MVALTHKCGILYHICGTQKNIFLGFWQWFLCPKFRNYSNNKNPKEFFNHWKIFWKIVKIKKKIVCTTYVVYYTTFVGQSYHIRGILYHICGILYHKCVFPGNPYTVKWTKLCLSSIWLQNFNWFLNFPTFMQSGPIIFNQLDFRSFYQKLGYHYNWQYSSSKHFLNFWYDVDDYS